MVNSQTTPGKEVNVRLIGHASREGATKQWHIAKCHIVQKCHLQAMRFKDLHI